MSTTDTDTTIPPEDPSQYIRTYAKDVALLTGKNPELARGAPQFAPVPAAAPPVYAHTTFTPPDASLIVPSAPPTEPPSLTKLESDAARESVLARLRAKVASSKMPDAPLMSFPSIQAPASPLPPPPVPTYVPPPPVEVPKKSADAPAPFHSYSTDFSDRIDTQHASQFSVLAAEDANAWKAPATKKKLNLLPIIAGVVLVAAGGGGVFAAYHFLSQAAPIATAPSVPSLIVPDEKVVLTGSGSTLLKALANQAGQSLPSDEVLLTYTTQATTTKQGVIETPESGGALITALNLPAPDILIRNIDPSSMVGVVNAGTQTRAFFILRVLSYERTFAGMLAWEPTIGRDLVLLYPSYPAPPPVQVIQPVVATTTATTTPVVVAPVQTLPQLPPQFVDEVVDNHNARALKDSEGRTIIIYGYADPQTLIIARDEAAFTLLIGRLQASQQ